MRSVSFARFNPTARRNPRWQVLLIDDDPDYLDLLAAEISQIPLVQVHVASSAAEAVKLLGDNDFHLIVTDWELKETTSPEIFRRVDDNFGRRGGGEKNAKTPILFMSASEKVVQTQTLGPLKRFRAVSFILKSCGPLLIGLTAEYLLRGQTASCAVGH
jgi:CheY-like chemotaxis protein